MEGGGNSLQAPQNIKATEWIARAKPPQAGVEIPVLHSQLTPGSVQAWSGRNTTRKSRNA